MQTNAKKFSGDGVSDIIVQIEELLRKNFINKSQPASYLGISPVWLLLGVGGTFVQPEDLELANALKRALELEKERVSELERELESEKSRSEEYKTRFEESLEVIQNIMGS